MWTGADLCFKAFPDRLGGVWEPSSPRGHFGRARKHLEMLCKRREPQGPSACSSTGRTAAPGPHSAGPKLEDRSLTVRWWLLDREPRNRVSDLQNPAVPRVELGTLPRQSHRNNAGVGALQVVIRRQTCGLSCNAFGDVSDQVLAVFDPLLCERDPPLALGCSALITSYLASASDLSDHQSWQQNAVLLAVETKELDGPGVPICVGGSKHIDDHAAVDHDERWWWFSHAAAQSNPRRPFLLSSQNRTSRSRRPEIPATRESLARSDLPERWTRPGRECFA